MRFGQQLRTSLAAAALMLAATAAVIAAERTAANADPKVPPGMNPGGQPVVAIGRGIDYTRPAVADMLARDGEGEIVGYDFIDDDRRPFARGGNSDTEAVEIFLAEGQAATLVVVRMRLAPTPTAGRALRFAAEAPGRIVWCAEHLITASEAELILTAATRFADKLYIVAVSGPAIAGLLTGKSANLIVVNAAPTTEKGADLAGDVAAPDLLADGRNSAAASDPAVIASARVAALAARLRAIEPEASPADLKRRILALAEPRKANDPAVPVISNPRRHFWLE